MPDLSRLYSQSLVDAMKGAGVWDAVDAGTPAVLQFSVAFGPLTVRCELDFREMKTREQRMQAAYNCHRDALKQVVEAEKKLAAAVEQKKVAACPKCKAWFPTTAERNEHKRLVHRKLDDDPPASLIIQPNMPAASERPIARLAEF